MRTLDAQAAARIGHQGVPVRDSQAGCILCHRALVHFLVAVDSDDLHAIAGAGDEAPVGGVLGSGPVSAAPNPSQRANPDVGCENVLSRNPNADPLTARNSEQGGANFFAVGTAFGCV